MDISEQCGHTLEEQIELFNGIKPLFANKPLLVIMNKVDVMRPEELPEEKKELLKVFDQDGMLYCYFYHEVIIKILFQCIECYFGPTEIRNL